MMNESCVETTAAPEWLSKLESRREKLTKRRLGHESGAGAPCTVCGTKCPGLDLHFWRKVCRNCKCRKEQHECQDDDLSGWAQFEILGQIRSKPAYINIKTFADKPVKLDWVPPNASTDLVSDYMTQLGTSHIPIEGTDAAAKRKQQLEFQVPAHDLDPTLCDNLTEKEQEQLKEYVNKIKENCVGQGNIVRVGSEINVSLVAPMAAQSVIESMQGIAPTVYKDKLASFILNSETVQGIMQPASAHAITGSVAKQSIESPMVPDFHQSPLLSDKNKYKLNLMRINSQAIQSGTVNGPFYDGILRNLKEQKVNYEKDHLLKPLDDFRREYLRNDKFQSDVNRFVSALGDRFLDTIPEVQEEDTFSTPKKMGQRHEIWNSPLPFKSPVHSKQAQLFQQETPMRKVNFLANKQKSGIQDLYNPQTGLPLIPTIKNDRILSTVLNSDVVQGILHEPAKILPGTKLIVSNQRIQPDFGDSPALSDHSKAKLHDMRINSQGIQSGVMHGWAYDKVFPDLYDHNIDFKDDTILQPIENFRRAYNENEPFRYDVNNYVKNLGTDMIDKIPLNTPYSSPAKSFIHPSGSSDSGFESIPATPNYATYPGMEAKDNLNAVQGKLSLVPGISEMNMYPTVQPGTNYSSVPVLNEAMQNLNVSPQQGQEIPATKTTVMLCQHCNENILTGDVAVTAERAGKDVAWHPKCFVCHKCNELLADLVYFFHGGKVYCARDLADILKIPRCAACDELIFTKEYVAAEGATFHVKHFCCYQCDTPLAGKQYLPDEKTNMPLCLNCYEQYHAAKCENCKKPIGASEQGVAFGKIHWHRDCFLCAGLNCHKSLIGGRFCVKHDKPFCSPQCVKSIIA